MNVLRGRGTCRRWSGPVLSLALLCCSMPAVAQEPSDRPIADQQPRRWLLVCCGLPGDDQHRERLTTACQQLLESAEPALGVSDDRLQLLVGDEGMQADLADQTDADVGVCTKETLADALDSLSQSVAEQDSCWIMLLGHAHLYGSRSQYNVLGPDPDHAEFAAWSEAIACREQVYWITTPVSGFWVKPLSGDKRVVISATEADLEFTGTEMPYALSDLLAGKGEHQTLEDIDQDGVVSLLDLYLATNLEIHGRFQALERLQTEHAQLEDNGDGRGSEVQQAYLPEDDGGEVELRPDRTPITSQAKDGFRSRQIVLHPPEQP